MSNSSGNMNEQVKRLWVQALRSRKYQQGKGSLCQDNAFCCLGVLCDLHSKETGVQWTVDGNRRNYLGMNYVLPQAVADWAGVEKDPFVIPPRKERNQFQRKSPEKPLPPKALSELNDGEYTFNKIASLIEKQL